MLTINTRDKKLFTDDGGEELADVAASFTPQKVEFIKAGGSYAVVFGKKLQSFACETLNLSAISLLRRRRKFSMKIRD